jgi:hypothetical protein
MERDVPWKKLGLIGRTWRLKLIRFRGHPILLESGGHDAEIKNALPAGVPAQDCRTG